jgi:hypothetical protein
VKREKLAALFFAAVTMLVFVASAGAVDGTIEINQAKVLAAGGFPYVINTTNTSYRLTGSLTVSSTTADAIDVKMNHVTIDLNGFAISGPGGSTTGTGINGPNAGALTVENGSITGFGAGGGAGVYTGNNGIVRNVQADANGVGIETGIGSVISGNTVNGNSADGIGCNGSGGGCLISGNTIDNNGAYGIGGADATTGYRGNVLNGNSGGPAFGGTSMGNNICNGKLC